MTLTIPRPVSPELAARPCPRVSTPSTSDDREHARRYPFSTTIQYEPGGMMRVPGGIEQFDGAFECDHGRLPSDLTDPCGCFSADQERARPLHIRRPPETRNPGIPEIPTPRRRRAPAITPEEARKMLTTVTGSPDTEAPYGRKGDGSPRRKPGRQPKAVAAAAAPAQSRMTPPPEPPAEPDFITEKLAEVDARLTEIKALATTTRDERDKLNAKLHELDDEAEKLRKLQEALA